ncbi:MAG TPA: LysR substrate-binding domain-containing protein [Noviherbaspirillum sp.]|nr:LysR substrate-binding domain-containing protein [Noviherbaspirillum sp.]
MPRNLDIGLLRTFIHVADAGSMTAAANRLHLTQGAISQQIKRLEDMFGHVILERGRQGLRLTDEGERLLGKARKLVKLNDEIWSDMQTPEIAGQVRLGVPYDLIGTHLPEVLKAYARSYPDVDISLVSGSSPELVVALAAGKVDLALVEEPSGSTGGECLAIERLVWVSARDGRAAGMRPLPLCLVSETCAFRPLIFAALESANIEWRVVFENSSIEATSATVGADLAVTAWLASTVPAGLDILGTESGLPALPDFGINLHMPRSGASPAVIAMATCIREAYR